MNAFAEKCPDDFSFKNASTVLSRHSNQKGILKEFGSPDKASADLNREKWTYFDPKTKFQRMTVTFDVSKNIESILWIPFEEEEGILENLLRQYPDGAIKKIASRQMSSHDLTTESTYSDEKTTTILHNDAAKRVEAVAWYSEVRKPAFAK